MIVIMEATKSDPPKLPDMVMCGDHPSLNKTELSAKDVTADEKEKEKPKDKNTPSYAKISPTSSRTRTDGAAEERVLAARCDALRHEARRRLRERPAYAAFPLAAMGSFRWPPYLLAVWVLVLLLTHVLHCLVAALQRALPPLRKCISYFRAWTEDAWKAQTDINQKLVPIGLGAVTAVMYVVYFGLYVAYGAALWAVEPLCADADGPSADVETKIIDYIEDAGKTNSSIKSYSTET